MHQEAFVKARQILSSHRILTSYDRLRPLRLETDAAQSRGLGMALWQQQEDGQWRLLQCASRHITQTESRYSATEIELLAVTWAVQKARLFLAGSDFELIVDHRPLVPIINSKTLDELSTPHIVRMKEKLAPYRIKALWRQGIEHKVVDCLSRNPVETPSEEDLSGEAVLSIFIMFSICLPTLTVKMGSPSPTCNCLQSLMQETTTRHISS